MEVWMVDLAAVFIVAVSVILGAYKGLLLKLFAVAKIILLIVGTAILSAVLLVVLPKGLNGREIIAFAAAIILTGIVLAVIENALKLVDRVPVVNKINQFGGALIGVVYGIIVIWILLFALELCRDAAWCGEVRRAVLDSVVLGEMYRNNPLLKIIFIFMK